MLFDLNRLKSIRNQLNLTQFQFAKQAGVSQSLIAKIESGRLDPSYSVVKKLEDTTNRLSAKDEPDAKSIMTKKIISVDCNASSKEVINLLRKNDISQMPVLDGNKIVGTVSEESVIAKEDVKNLCARDLMVFPPPIVPVGTKRSVLMSLLRQFPFVLISDGSDLIGVVTKSDLLRTL